MEYSVDGPFGLEHGIKLSWYRNILKTTWWRTARELVLKERKGLTTWQNRITSLTPFNHISKWVYTCCYAYSKFTLCVHLWYYVALQNPWAIKVHLLWGFHYVNISKCICQWIAESLVSSWGLIHTECLLRFYWQLNDKLVQADLYEVIGNKPISMLICLKCCVSLIISCWNL